MAKDHGKKIPNRPATSVKATCYVAIFESTVHPKYRLRKTPCSASFSLHCTLSACTAHPMPVLHTLGCTVHPRLVLSLYYILSACTVHPQPVLSLYYILSTYTVHPLPVLSLYYMFPACTAYPRPVLPVFYSEAVFCLNFKGNGRFSKCYFEFLCSRAYE